MIFIILYNYIQPILETGYFNILLTTDRQIVTIQYQLVNLENYNKIRYTTLVISKFPNCCKHWCYHVIIIYKFDT